MADKPYEVGYGKPPKANQFKKGGSGNPKGRRKGVPNHEAKKLNLVLADEVGRKITITENGRKRRVTKLEAAAISLTTNAIRGDIRAINALFKLAPAAQDDRSRMWEEAKRQQFNEAYDVAAEVIRQRYANQKDDGTGNKSK